MEFIALDFETANEHRSSACEISLVKVQNNSVVETFSRLIKPHESMAFNPWNTSIHGLSARDVQSADSFDVVIQDAFSFIGKSPLVAHNASFDLSVLRRTAELYSMQIPDLEFYCTRVLAKCSPQVNLASYSLANVCHFLGIAFEETHRAEADAVACAQVVFELTALSELPSLVELAASLQVKPGMLSSTGYQGVSSQKSPSGLYAFTKEKAAAFVAGLSKEDLNYDDDFKDKEVVFTGTLSSMGRLQAQEKVLRAGGLVGSGVNKNTSLVVVGSPYDVELRPGGDLSGKLQKVLTLRAKGVDVVLLSESEFLELFEN